MNTPRLPVGERIRYFRRKKNGTQTAVAGLCGTSERYLSLLENGQRVPSTEVLTRIAAELGWWALHGALARGPAVPPVCLYRSSSATMAAWSEAWSPGPVTVSNGVPNSKIPRRSTSTLSSLANSSGENIR